MSISPQGAWEPPQSQPYRPMPVIRDAGEMLMHRRKILLAGGSVGFVPTMGALHEGHASLIRQALLENNHVFVSIYVNPTQFGANEDLSTYPRTWEADMKLLKELNDECVAEAASDSPLRSYRREISAVFAPTTDTMYPNLPPSSDPSGHGSFVTITPLSSVLEGAIRPTFFRGVATVCMKLFNIMTPRRVYFGQKDIQQTVIIRRMVEDFHLGIDVKIVPTVRGSDGLAMSSRNVYLGTRRRKTATWLYRALKLGEEQYRNSARTRRDILFPTLNLLNGTALDQDQNQDPTDKACFEIEYISLADPDTLEEVEEVDEERGAILSGAIRMLPLLASKPGEDCGVGEGKSAVRIIDNVILEPLVESE
ncbi:MAG: hypothetical protein M1823_005919 [Watsoniomyces obsoletus]|nr:MAG: hypothetical protein M1823_005919 [Watsoniomyces obsoletus]